MTEPTQKEKQEIKPICPIMSQYCKDKHCMFFRKGYTTTNGRGQKDSCWILDGFIGLVRTWEIKE